MKNNLLILFLLLTGYAFSWPLPGNPGYECMTMGQGSEILCYYDDSQGGGCQIIVTNGTGTCTNCTAMSPSDCQSAKDEILSNLDSVNSRLTEVQNDLNSIWYNGSPSLNDLYNQGFDFLQPETKLSGWFVNYQDNVNEFQGYGDLFSLRYPDYVDSSDGYATGAYYGGIYKYWSTKILPALEYVSDVRVSAYDKVSDEQNRVQQLSSYVDDNINCSACSSGGSGGGGGSSPGISTGCPCSETMKSLLDVVQAIKLDTASIDLTTVKIRELVEKIKSLLKDINNNVSNITYSVGRLDDYVTDDLSNSVYRIEIAISNLVSSVSSNNESYISLSYSNAVERVPTLAWHEKLTSNSFDFVAYSSRSNWFSRIEYLLMRSAGVFDSIGDTNVNFSTDEQSQIEKINEYDWQFLDFKAALLSKVTELQNKKNVFKPFGDIFDIEAQDLPTKITFLPDIPLGDATGGVVGGGTGGSGSGGGSSSSSTQADFISLIGSTFPAIEMDLTFKDEVSDSFCLLDFVKLAHSFFKWFWYFIGFICVFGMVFVYVRLIIRLLRWFHKIVRSWASNLIVDRRYNL